MAASWISSAQNGHRFIFIRLQGLPFSSSAGFPQCESRQPVASKASFANSSVLKWYSHTPTASPPQSFNDLRKTFDFYESV
jgi:hypothetical protein